MNRNNHGILKAVNSYSLSGKKQDFIALQDMICPTEEYRLKFDRIRNEISEAAGATEMSSLTHIITADKIAHLFANELEELRKDDPYFIGTPQQIDYIKEVISADIYLYKECTLNKSID